MAIDPTIYRRSYEAAAGPAIDPMAMRRQQVVEEAAAADRDYRATQLQGEQAKLEAANRKQATLGQIGRMAAAGDGAGARRTALEAGEFDIIDKLDSMDDSQRKRTLEVTRSIAPVIASLKQLPPAMRMQAASSVLVERGLTPEQIAGLDLSDAGIDAKIGEAMTITEYFAQQKDNRDFGFKQQEFGYRVRNDAANRGVTLRGQNMTDARSREAAARAARAPGAPGAPVKTTEAERTAGFLANRLAGALTDISGATANSPDAAAPGVGEWFASMFGETATNNAVSADRQQVRNAQMDALDSALTLGTGAAYTAPQLESYRQSYFPQVGDKPSTVRGKKERFVRLLESAAVKAGNATPPALISAIQQGRAELAATPKPKANAGGWGKAQVVKR